MGGTGSTWLAKLLNSHPDVFCSHEAVASRVFPATQYGPAEILNYLRCLAWDSMHGAYSAVGDVGSIWQQHAAGLHQFRTAVLLRHPARVLSSRLATYPHDQSFTEITTGRDALDLWGIDLAKLDPMDRIFVHDLLIFASQVWALARKVRIIRIEDMASPELCHEALKHLTGLDYPIGLIHSAIAKPVNQRTKPIAIRQIVSGFTARQRDWYRVLLRDAAPRLGYSLEEPVTLARG